MGEPTIGSRLESSTDTSDEQPVALFWLFGNAATADSWMHLRRGVCAASSRARTATCATPRQEPSLLCRHELLTAPCCRRPGSGTGDFAPAADRRTSRCSFPETTKDAEIDFVASRLPSRSAWTAPVQRDCRDYAITSGEAYGIWGATSESDRRHLTCSTYPPSERPTSPRLRALPHHVPPGAQSRHR